MLVNLLAVQIYFAMNSDNTKESLLHPSRKKVNVVCKDYRFPKVWSSNNKHSDPMRSNPHLSLRTKRCDSNWSSETISSSALRTSEITFGCDQEISINKNCFRPKTRNTFIDDNFMEFSISQRRLRHYGSSYVGKHTKFVNRQTQTDSLWGLIILNRTHFIMLIVALMCITSGLMYLINKTDKSNWYYSFNGFSKHKNKLDPNAEPLPNVNRKQDLRNSGTALDILANNKKYDEYESAEPYRHFVKLCENMNNVVQQLQSKLTAVEKEVALFHQYDISQRQMDELVYGHIHGPAADYALESTGGSIVGTPGTVTYAPSPVTVTFLGLPIWKHIVSHPRIIIKGAIQPGQCWTFQGSEGKVIIRLSFPIRVSAVALEHFPAHLLPSNNDILSAPRQFSATGILECTDCSDEEKNFKLGLFEYQKTGPSRQMFYVKQEIFLKMHPVQLVEFHFKNNHGNPDYTSVYRVRVHGKVVTDT